MAVSAGGAQQAAQQALAEGAEIILGPCSPSRSAPPAKVARQRGIPLIAFSTDAGVAARASTVELSAPSPKSIAIVAYAATQGNVPSRR